MLWQTLQFTVNLRKWIFPQRSFARGLQGMAKTESGRLQTAARLFHYETELKFAIRRQLGLVELGLVEADGGHEREVATGRIDITARDTNGHFVVIELKAGPCPNGALEQVLAYSNDLETETGTPCRSVLVASQFSDRLRAAAMRARDVSLVTYEVGEVNLGSGLAEARP
jgi:RecB family endonuclease NucS